MSGIIFIGLGLEMNIDAVLQELANDLMSLSEGFDTIRVVEKPRLGLKGWPDNTEVSGEVLRGPGER
jgi:hypothetical protein